jgi:MFS family permease
LAIASASTRLLCPYFRPHKLAWNQEEVKRYLKWLARQLNSNNIPNNFLIEKMQPRWLETKAQKWHYRLIVSLIWGLIWGLILGFTEELIFGLMFGLIFGLNNIATVETFKFSFSRFGRKVSLKTMTWWLTWWLIGVLIGVLIFGFTENLIGNLVVVLIFGLTGFLIGVLIGVLREDFQVRETPNQGVVASAKNVLFVTVVIYPAALLMFFLRDYVLLEENVLLQDYPLVGFQLSLFLGICLGGGFPVIQHITLRFLLHRQGHIPHNYAQFLRYTTERQQFQIPRYRHQKQWRRSEYQLLKNVVKRYSSFSWRISFSHRA